MLVLPKMCMDPSKPLLYSGKADPNATKRRTLAFSWRGWFPVAGGRPAEDTWTQGRLRRFARVSGRTRSPSAQPSGEAREADPQEEA